MTKMQTVMYGIALALILTGALIVEGAPLVAIGMITVAGASIRIAERG